MRREEETGYSIRAEHGCSTRGKEEEKEEEEEGREAEGKRRRRLLLLRGYTNIGTSRVNCRPLSRISAASCTARIHIYFAAAHIS